VLIILLIKEIAMAKTISQVPGPGHGLINAQDLDYKTTREDWNIYELEDGTILRAKLLATRISRALAEDNETIYYTPNGEPWYNMTYVVSVVVDVPENLKKR
jgi:hypothetical protein